MLAVTRSHILLGCRKSTLRARVRAGPGGQANTQAGAIVML